LPPFLWPAAQLAAPIRQAAGEDAGADVKPVFADTLPNVPGKSITAVVVNYAPGSKSAKHHHAGSVFVYVLAGAIRSENSATGPRAGTLLQSVRWLGSETRERGMSDERNQCCSSTQSIWSPLH
jgi:hypothetical protein